MGRGINRIISCVVILWVIIFIFQKEILSFIAGWSPSFIKDILLQVVGFMAYWGNQAWGLVKLALKWLIDAAGRVVSGADPLYGLVKGFANILTNIIKGIIDLFSPLVGKFFAR